MIENYRYFVDKLCTVLTHPVSLYINDAKQHAQFFTGIVREVNECGIFLEHLITKKMAFYTFPVIGIVEEQGIAKDDPNYEKVKAEMEKKKAPPVRQVPNAPTNNNLISVEEMTRLAKNIKEKTNTRASS